MTLPIAFLAEARVDLTADVDWYEERSSGKGARFFEHVEENLAQIAEMPEMHQIVYKQVRKRVLTEFPYNIFYRAEPERIVVIAVFHHKRNPRTWKKRATLDPD